MEVLKRRIAKVAPFVLCWAMGLVTYYMSEHTDKCLEALIAIVGVLQ